MDKSTVKLQDGETVDFRWISESELLSMSTDELATVRILKNIYEQNS